MFKTNEESTIFTSMAAQPAPSRRFMMKKQEIASSSHAQKGDILMMHQQYQSSHTEQPNSPKNHQ
jgi:hypothetical protein